MTRPIKHDQCRCGEPKTLINGLMFCAKCDGKPAQLADGSLTMAQRDVPRLWPPGP